MKNLTELLAACQTIKRGAGCTLDLETLDRLSCLLTDAKDYVDALIGQKSVSEPFCPARKPLSTEKRTTKPVRGGKLPPLTEAQKAAVLYGVNADLD